MYLSRRVRFQLAFFAVITLVAGGIMGLRFLDLPNLLFGVGHYRITLQLANSGGLYANGDVTYRGTPVGRVDAIRLTPNGVDAVLSMDSNVRIPADLTAEVHSQSAVGEQFVELVPRSDSGPSLQNGDIVPFDRTTVPPDINTLLNATNNGLQAIPGGDLTTVIDEANTAFGGLGPELSRIVRGTTTLTADARANLDAITTVIDQSKPLLDSQTDSADSIHAWAANLATVTDELRTQDQSIRGVLSAGPEAADQTRQLFERLKPTLPILMANLASAGQVAVTYQPNIEQLLVLLPRGIEVIQGAELADRNLKPPYKGINLSFNLNLNLPPPCTTGFLPATQMRSASDVDYPDRPPGDMYCRVPQDSSLNVRGARNLPCVTRPGKRAPTVKMCESDENYVPLNDGYNWKGDPNATLSGQPVPQTRTGESPPAAAQVPPPLAAAEYDPATGAYVGPDGQRYTQSDLAHGGAPVHNWQDMLMPQ